MNNVEFILPEDAFTQNVSFSDQSSQSWLLSWCSDMPNVFAIFQNDGRKGRCVSDVTGNGFVKEFNI